VRGEGCEVMLCWGSCAGVEVVVCVCGGCVCLWWLCVFVVVVCVCGGCVCEGWVRGLGWGGGGRGRWVGGDRMCMAVKHHTFVAAPVLDGSLDSPCAV
jgi:hypothetical protein